MRVLLGRMGNSAFNRSIWEGLSRGFATLGHEVQEVENATLPRAEALDRRPDLLLSVHGGDVPTGVLSSYREEAVPTAVYLLDEPYEVDRSSEWAKHFDWVFTADRATVPIHAGPSEAAFLPLGYDAQRFERSGKAYASEILVLGSPFGRRLELLAPLRRRWGPHITWVGPGWQPFCPKGNHVDRYVDPDVCARFYRGAAIVLNVHRDSFWSHFGPSNKRRIEATHLNPRFWEAAACGAFQLCSYRADASYFGEACVTFRHTEELETLLEYYLREAEERSRLAEALHRAVAPHDYRARAREILTLVGALPARAPAEKATAP